MSFLKSRSIQVKLVKDNETNTDPTAEPQPVIPTQEILDLYDGLIQRTTTAVIQLIIGVAAARTGSAIIIHHATKK